MKKCVPINQKVNETDKFLKRCKLATFIQEEMKIMNRSITNKETELVTKNYLQRKAWAQKASPFNSIKSFKIIYIYINFQKIDMAGKLSNFYEPSIT